MFSLSVLVLSALLPALSATQQLRSDPGVAGPPLELVHLYNNQWPTGITVSKAGRKFANYPSGLDPNNTNTGTNQKYAVQEILSNGTEIPYPGADINNPPGGAINYTITPPNGANYATHLLGVQSVVLDPLDRLWILDTGRSLTTSGTLVPASPGGPKLIGVDISSNTVIQTIVFPPTVAYPDSYLNDVRFDLRPSVTASGKGVAYITDSSSEGRNGIIIVDLGTGESWRHLDGTRAVRSEPGFVPYVWGQPLYYIPGPGLPLTTVPLGSDGIALSADGETLFFGPIGSRMLYSVPTVRIRDRSANSELLARAAVNERGERGVSDGFETDSNGLIYAANMEQNLIGFYDPKNGVSVASDGYLYFNDNQLAFSSSFYPGTDRRERPFALFRVALPNNGSRVFLQ
ncbi:major royal jelly protein [Pyrenophora tritici-repentis]|nr:major royal jelly protein [Pyrenophora tritici-repentis]KAI1606722.1 major royal jelly protein [Pyrenophora tritici-repentis]